MSPRGKEQNEHMRTKTLEKINGAALSVFAEYGYNGATMKQISRAAGLSYGLVYHYYPSKEIIFRHLVDYALEGSIIALEQSMRTPLPAWEKIKNLSAYLVKFALTGESSLYFLIVLQAMTEGKAIPGMLKHIAERSELCYRKLIPAIVEAQEAGDAAEGDPEALAAAYFSFIQGLATLAFQGKGYENKITPDMLSAVIGKRNS